VPTLTAARFIFQIKVINLSAGEHKTEEFTKLNPLQKVPTVDDDGFVMSESRAIMAYLVNEKCPDSSLYPADPKKRFVIDQRLFYDATVFSQRCVAAIVISTLQLVSNFP
jgi:glutathione S-transferase